MTVKLEDDDFVTVKVEGAEDTRATSSRDAVMVKAGRKQEKKTKKKRTEREETIRTL